jgi:FtsZ-binding cell division protein ZapB
MFLFVSISFAAAVPKLVNYQGMLADSAGNPLTGSHSLTFRIYDDSTAGNLEWTEVQSAVEVQNGLFSVVLGGVTALNLPFDEAYWLEVELDGEIMPRMRFTSVGYAYRSVVADRAILADSALVAMATGATTFDSLHVMGNAVIDGDLHMVGAITHDSPVIVSDALDKVIQLRGVTFNWKEGDDRNMKYGLIAQEVEEVLPEMVHTNEKGYKAIEWWQLNGVYVGAIQELKARNDALKDENIAQQSRVTELEEENQKLRKTMQSIETRLSALEKNSPLYGSALDRYIR